MVISAKINAINGTAKTPVPILIPKTMASEAPNAAPDDIPRMYGEAIGFLNNPCIAQPATARADPTNAHNSILGNRTSITIMP